MSYIGYRQWDHIVQSNLELFSVDQMNDTFTVTIPVQTERSVYRSVTDTVLRIVVTRMEYLDKFVYGLHFYKGTLTATNKTPKFTIIGDAYYDENDVNTTMIAVKNILEYITSKPADPNIRYRSIQAVFGMLLSGISKHNTSFGTRTRNTVICIVKPPKTQSSHLRFTIAQQDRDVLEYYLQRPVTSFEVVKDTTGHTGCFEIYPNCVLLKCGGYTGSVFASPVFTLINVLYTPPNDRYRAFRSSMQSIMFPKTEIDNIRLFDVKDRTRFLTTTGGKITISEKKSGTAPEKVKESYKMVKH